MTDLEVLATVVGLGVWTVASYKVGWDMRGEADQAKARAARGADVEAGLALAAMPRDQAEAMMRDRLIEIAATDPEQFRKASAEMKRANERSAEILTQLAPLLPEGSGFRQQVEEAAQRRG